MFLRKSFMMIALTLSLFACAKKEALRHPPQFKPYEGIVTVEALRGSLIFNDIKSIKSEVTVGFLKEGKTVDIEGIVAYMMPESLNIRFFGPLGLTAAEVILLGNYLQVYVPFENTLYEGEIPHLLTPELPSSETIYSMAETDEGYTLNEFCQQKETMSLIRQYTFSRDTLLNTGISVYDKEGKFADVLFSDFSDSKLPMTVNVSLSNGFVMDIRLIEPQVNSKVSEELFKLKSHEDREVKPLKALFKKGKP
ncbi:MAG: hypothetical protein HY805_10515 [Nitrospirae bacterium]|nr:hypothetical protein [Nitrospirota bacterium]